MSGSARDLSRVAAVVTAGSCEIIRSIDRDGDMRVITSRGDKETPSVRFPRRAWLVSLRAEEINGMSQAQFWGASLSSAIMARVAESTERMRDSTVPLAQGE